MKSATLLLSSDKIMSFEISDFIDSIGILNKLQDPGKLARFIKLYRQQYRSRKYRRSNSARCIIIKRKYLFMSSLEISGDKYLV